MKRKATDKIFAMHVFDNKSQYKKQYNFLNGKILTITTSEMQRWKINTLKMVSIIN
jgi:hypothetical protein